MPLSAGLLKILVHRLLLISCLLMYYFM